MKSDNEIVYRLIYDVRQTLTTWERKFLSVYYYKYTNRYLISNEKGKPFFMEFVIYDYINGDDDISTLLIYRRKNDVNTFIRTVNGELVNLLVEIIKQTGNYNSVEL